MANSFSFYIFPPSKANNSLNIFIYRIIWLLYQSNSDFPKQFIFAISIEHRIKQPVCKMQKQKRNSKLHIQHSSLPYSSRILLCPQCFSNFLLTFCILPTTETGQVLYVAHFSWNTLQQEEKTSCEFKLQSSGRQERRLGKWNQNTLKTQTEYPYSKITIAYIIMSTWELSVLSHPL